MELNDPLARLEVAEKDTEATGSRVLNTSTDEFWERVNKQLNFGKV